MNLFNNNKNMIIDYIDNLETENVDNIHALQYMKVWLNMLASQILHYEELNNQNPLMKWCVLSFLDVWPDEDARICIYMWFANTLVNYVQLVWTLAFMQKKWYKIDDIKKNKDEIKKFSIEYTEKLIPEVLKWRNKVFAHFSFTDPRNEDNLGVLQNSIANPLSWNWCNYIIWNIKWWIWDEESNLPEWSLTKIYEELIPRYWPWTIRKYN